MEDNASEVRSQTSPGKSLETDFRSRFYAKYATFQNCVFSDSPNSDPSRSHRKYDYYLRGWLPSNKEENILEVACGTGNFLSFLAEKGYSSLKGIDISPQQVSLAQKKHLSVSCIDFFHYEYARDSIDLIVALDVVEHLSKSELFDFFDKCFAMLRTGGKIILQTPNGSGISGMTTWSGDITHELLLNPGSLSGVLRCCGFTDCEFRETGPIPFTYSHKSTVRWLIWKLIVVVWKFINLIETGSAGEGVLTRTFLTSARKS